MGSRCELGNHEVVHEGDEDGVNGGSTCTSVCSPRGPTPPSALCEHGILLPSAVEINLHVHPEPWNGSSFTS